MLFWLIIVQVMNLKLTEEVEKLETMLKLQSSINKDLHQVLSDCVALNCIVLSVVLYCVVLYSVVLYCIVLYCIVLYCIVLYCIVLYCIALHQLYWINSNVTISTSATLHITILHWNAYVTVHYTTLNTAINNSSDT